jgi:diaminohydroxyphosphoribosylaminopyrimidine deaminase/5-amino-6-(5-phosphoribosylamino)uracil reductase
MAANSNPREGVLEPMARAIELARVVRGRVSPNPPVGAVIVRDGAVMGEGSTQPPGGPHAEIVALAAAGSRARGSTLWVTLEPCCHHGRTPPCTEAIIKAGVASVVCSLEDPDVQVSGQGIQQLRAAGIEVAVQAEARECLSLLEDYIKHRRTGLPLVIAKFAASLDGKIATRTGDSRWVSGPQTLEWAHEERTRLDAICVGVNTVVIDDPMLTARPKGEEGGSHQPLRVVVDSRGRTPAGARVLEGRSQTLIATTAASAGDWRQEMSMRGAEVAVLPAANGRVDLQALLALLGARGCLNLLVEGGGILLGSFFDAGLIDRVQAVIAAMIIGGRTAPVAVAGRGVERMADASRLEGPTVRLLGADVLVEGGLSH